MINALKRRKQDYFLWQWGIGCRMSQHLTAELIGQFLKKKEKQFQQFH